MIDMILTLSIIYRHWVLEAAIAWEGYGTCVTGLDMVDISSNLPLWAAEGVPNNIRFIKGNLCVRHSKLLTYPQSLFF